MNILGFSSFGTTLETGILNTEGYYEARRDVGLKHNQVLLPLIENLLSDAGLMMQDIGLVVCTRGPGSFTAMRILLSTAKGLAAGSEAAFITIPTFNVIGRIFSWSQETVVPFLDGKKGKIYSASFSGGTKIASESDMPKPELLKCLEHFLPVLLVGKEQHLFKKEIECNPENYIGVQAGFSLVRTLISMGKIEFEKNGCCDKLVSPLYIRKSDAELQKES